MNLVEYLEENQDYHHSPNRGVRREANHEYLVDRVLRSSRIFGIANTASSYREVLLKNNIYRDIGVVDIVTFNPDLQDLCLFEIKVGNIERARKKAKSQLYRSYDFFKERFDISSRMMAVISWKNLVRFGYIEFLK
jgi:hypothetical protein